MAASTSILREKIARRAYEIYIEGGRKSGGDLENWLKAEKEITRSEANSSSELSSPGATRRARQPQNPVRSLS